MEVMSKPYRSMARVVKISNLAVGCIFRCAATQGEERGGKAMERKLLEWIEFSEDFISLSFSIENNTA